MGNSGHAEGREGVAAAIVPTRLTFVQGLFKRILVEDACLDVGPHVTGSEGARLGLTDFCVGGSVCEVMLEGHAKVDDPTDHDGSDTEDGDEGVGRLLGGSLGGVSGGPLSEGRSEGGSEWLEGLSQHGVGRWL